MLNGSVSPLYLDAASSCRLKIEAELWKARHPK
jgi:hypothetical protein